MPDKAPPPGLYQQLLTEGLEQQLRDLQETLVETDRLDPQEAPRGRVPLCGVKPEARMP
jgi:hypothetical protein